MGKIQFYSKLTLHTFKKRAQFLQLRFDKIDTVTIIIIIIRKDRKFRKEEIDEEKEFSLFHFPWWIARMREERWRAGTGSRRRGGRGRKRIGRSRHGAGLSLAA